MGFRFDHYHGNSHTIGRMRISVSNEKDPDALWPVPDEIAAVLALPDSERSDTQRRALAVERMDAHAVRGRLEYRQRSG